MYSIMMRFVGILFVTLVSSLLVLHVHGFFTVILRVVKKRLGATFGLTWVAIGITLFYNIVFNYFWAIVVKPGGPKEL